MSECSCETCQSWCAQKAGYFAPGQLEAVAAYLGISVQELFNTRLVVETSIDGKVKVLVPACGAQEPGTVIDGNTVNRPEDTPGPCTFYQDGWCSIHAVKPVECAQAHHSLTGGQMQDFHGRVGWSWNTPEHQAEIERLLDETG